MTLHTYTPQTMFLNYVSEKKDMYLYEKHAKSVQKSYCITIHTSRDERYHCKLKENNFMTQFLVHL